MMTFGAEPYATYRYSTETPSWEKAERLAYCEQESRRPKRHFLIQLLFSIFA
ncbi:MAG: hypothetical protein KBT01_04445 [Clostridiales bacterium]|nr:hypothetical protein [Candidatus Blautia equi]